MKFELKKEERLRSIRQSRERAAELKVVLIPSIIDALLT